MKISLITTVLNEEKEIEAFFQSIFLQTRLPDEVVVCDAFSKDGTVRKIKAIVRGQNIKVKVIKKRGIR